MRNCGRGRHGAWGVGRGAWGMGHGARAAYLVCAEAGRHPRVAECMAAGGGGVGRGAWVVGRGAWGVGHGARGCVPRLR